MHATLRAPASARSRLLPVRLAAVPLAVLGLVTQATGGSAQGAVLGTSTVTTTTTTATGSTALPFDLPAPSTLRSSPKKVFAHWVPTLPVSLDNQDPASDYYKRNYLTPTGEGGKHAAYGGFLRDRPLGRAPLSGDWRLQDMQREVRQAISSGLDGFSVVIYNTTPGNRSWENVKLMMQAAASVDPGFKIVIQPDMSGTPGKLDAASLARSMAQLANYSSAYRLGDGRTVISPFLAEKHSAAWWSNFLSILRNTHGRSVAFWPMFLNEQTNATAFAPITYGMGNWGSRNPAWTNPNITYSTGPMGRVAKIHALGDKWMQPVSVQDERPRSGIFDEAGNTQVLRNTWEIARRSNSAAVQLNTWSDYPEGSQMAPSAKNGWSFLDISAYYMTWYKTGTRPRIVRDTVYLTHRTQPWAAKPTFPQTKLMSLRGGTPARNTIEALTFLTAPGTVTITAGSRTHTCSQDAGVDVCTVPLSTGTVSAKVTRSGSTVAKVTSPHKVTSTPYVQDLHYVAVSSRREGGDVSTGTAGPTGTASTTVSVSPSADTYANEGAPSTNYGSRSTLASKGGTSAVSYLRFAIPAAPAGKSLKSAALQIRTTGDSFAGTTSDHAVTLASNSWSEATVTWKNRPSAGTNRLGTITTDVAPNTVRKVALDAADLKPLAGSTRTIAISDLGENSLWFWSRGHGNASFRPKLVLTYG